MSPTREQNYQNELARPSELPPSVRDLVDVWAAMKIPRRRVYPIDWPSTACPPAVWRFNWTFTPGLGAQHTEGIMIRVSLNSEDFGQWLPIDDLAGELAYDAMVWASNEDGRDGLVHDESGLMLIEAIARWQLYGEREDQPAQILIDVVVDGAPALTCQADMEWTPGDDEGEFDVYASPMSCNRSMTLTRAARRYLNTPPR